MRLESERRNSAGEAGAQQRLDLRKTCCGAWPGPSCERSGPETPGVVQTEAVPGSHCTRAGELRLQEEGTRGTVRGREEEERALAVLRGEISVTWQRNNALASSRLEGDPGEQGPAQCRQRRAQKTPAEPGSPSPGQEVSGPR